METEKSSSPYRSLHAHYQDGLFTYASPSESPWPLATGISGTAALAALVNGQAYVAVEQGTSVYNGSLLLDRDDDGLTDAEESVLLTASDDRDSDDDGLIDGEETLRIGLMAGARKLADPTLLDTPDADPAGGLTDGLADGLERGLTRAELERRIGDWHTDKYLIGTKLVGGATVEIKGTQTDGGNSSYKNGKLLVDSDPAPAP